MFRIEVLALKKAYYNEREKPLSKKLLASRLGIATFCTLLFIIPFSVLLRGLVVTHADSPTVSSTIFLDSTAAAFTITTAGSSGTISYTVTDLSGAAITTGQSPVTNRQANLTLPTEPDGYYVLHIADRSIQPPASQTISFAIVAPFTTGADSPFGVGVHFTGGNNPGLVSLITTMGAGSIRDDASWAMIERMPGQYSFNNFDPYMQVLQQNNIDPLLILDYNSRFYDQSSTPYDDAGLTAFANYAKALVSHYGPQLKEVEVYNEYNGPLSTGPCAQKPSCYAQMLRYTYQAIKSVRPDVTVIGGAAYYADLSWFSQLFQDGALRYVDAISDHPYTALDIISPELEGTGQQMIKLEDLIKRYNNGKAKPIWITELGWPTSFLHVSERAQADYLVRGAVLSLAAGVQRFFWYDLLNDGTDYNKVEQNFGLLRRPDAAGRYTPKPSYVAYVVLARQLTHLAFAASEAVGWGIYDERFTNNMRVLWTTLGHLNVVVTTNHPVTVTSMTGRAQTYTPSGGHIVLSLTGDPIYLQGSVSKVAWENPICGLWCP